jgi:hypothetical protein
MQCGDVSYNRLDFTQAPYFVHFKPITRLALVQTGKIIQENFINFEQIGRGAVLIIGCSDSCLG